ncbi:beta-ketoacyl-[acyl-carrier-protein] synthase family protein [Streptomyces sp. NPDC088557]|uniref:beta-ketoacyl-[acyl-carrier-protein] synthase family protein n=1 Tax=Streptomyces sp. NPDC088557 TaxID=3365867 RepID=UPI0038137EE5
MSRAREPLAVTGLGMVTPAGIGTDTTWREVLTGRPTAATDPGATGPLARPLCRVTGFDPHRHTGGRRPWQYDRGTQFALAAAREAVDDARLAPGTWDGTRGAVVLGSAAGGVARYELGLERLRLAGPSGVSPLTLPGFLPNMAAGQVALALGARGPVHHTASACASGAGALALAALLLRSGACDIAVAGGTDAMITPLCVAAFARMNALSSRPDPATASRPFDRDRDGFVLGEGAALLVLERAADATARGAPVRAHLVGAGSAADAHHAVAPHPGARGLEAAVRLALTEAGAEPGDVDHINAHGTGTPLNDRAEALLVTRLHPGAAPPTVTSAKGALGHTMGAAGAVEAALTVLTVQHGQVPPTAGFHTGDADTSALRLVTGCALRQRVRLALSHSAGFGGHNTVLAFRPARS